MKIFSAIFIVWILSGPSAWAQMRVTTNNGTQLLCQDSSGPFWSCESGYLLFLPGPSFGQQATLHQMDLHTVEVPRGIEDMKDRKIVFSNRTHFQYQKEGMSADQAFYRKFNLMMGFEPALRSCGLEKCSQLYTKIFRDAIPFDESGAQAKAIDFYIKKKFDVVSDGRDKTLEGLNRLVLVYKYQDSLRYDYLLDGCFARAHLVAEDLKSQGYAVKKIWAYGFGLWASQKGKPLNFFGWRYHVAPMVELHGSYFVIEPGLFDRAVSAYVWLQSISGLNKDFIFDGNMDEELLSVKRLVRVNLSEIARYPEVFGDNSVLTEAQRQQNAREILQELPIKK